MKIGITGHQAREGIDWSWVCDAIRTELGKIGRVEKAISSLAEGSDQVFAEVALDLRIPVLAIVPMPGYERQFNGRSLINYRRLIKECEVLHLPRVGDDEQCFLEAGQKIVRDSDLMFAVWDGEKSEGKGGTGDIVDFARLKAKPVIHFDPIALSIRRI